MRRKVYPDWERNVALLLIVKDYASFGTEQKAIIRDSASGTVLATSVTVLAAFHHLCFLPIVFLAGQVGVKGHKLEKASHTRNITDVVSSVRAEPTAHG